jgi:hypothetical protein
MFRVTVLNLTENTKDSWEYDRLIDALQVAQNVDVSTPDEFMAKPAMTPEFFAENLWMLLTHGFVNVRKDVMVFLWRIDEDGIERPVVSAIDMLRGIRFPVGAIPNSRPPVEDTNIVRGSD